jgi:hypothetical protein
VDRAVGAATVPENTSGVGPLASAVFYVVLADLDAPTGFRQAAAFAVVVATRMASLHWGLQNPLPSDLIRKLNPRRHPGDDDTPPETARDTPQ